MHSDKVEDYTRDFGQPVRTEMRHWVNEGSSVRADLRADGDIEISVRSSPLHTWGPAIHLLRGTDEARTP